MSTRHRLCGSRACLHGAWRPAEQTREEGIAYDVASALVGGVLPELTYRSVVAMFGLHGAAELAQLVGRYCMVSVTLNAFEVPVPAG